MNKNELKKVLKPLIKECIKEVLFEEKGALSHIIAEVAGGLSAVSKPAVVKESTVPKFKSQPKKQKSEKSKLARKKLLDAIGRDAYNGVDLFEGTTPTSAPAETSSQGALSGVSPNDPGVDITGLFGEKAFAMTQRLMEKK